MGTIKSIVKSTMIDTEFSRPLFNRERFALVGQKDVFARVIHLFRVRRPYAVLRRITQIIIFAFDSKSWRALAHVGKEILKGQTPAITNGDAASLVSLGRFCRVVASRFHVGPSPVRSVVFIVAVLKVELSHFAYSFTHLVRAISERQLIGGPFFICQSGQESK